MKTAEVLDLLTWFKEYVQSIINMCGLIDDQQKYKAVSHIYISAIFTITDTSILIEWICLQLTIPPSGYMNISALL
jgi:hypothetical protein